MTVFLGQNTIQYFKLASLKWNYVNGVQTAVHCVLWKYTGLPKFGECKAKSSAIPTLALVAQSLK